MNDALLSRYLHRKLSRKALFGLFAAIPLFALLSFLWGPEIGATPEAPGGKFFEIAFWATSLGSAFLSFIMLEILFRSHETRLLASWPIKPLTLFLYQMKRVFKGIGISTCIYAAFWLPLITSDVPVVLLSIALWPIGMCVCAAVASAIILYAGNAGTQKDGSGSFGAMAFSTAPAIALAVSLITTLLLKLLAEALLKPGFFYAALTASGITLLILIVSFVYAARLYATRYYAILASFFDTDLVLLNANYDFVDNKQAKSIRDSSSVESAICQSYVAQFRRRYALSSVLAGTFAVILMIVLYYSPEYLDSFYVPLIALVPWILFSHPWSALQGKDIRTGLIEFFPVSQQIIRRSYFKACYSLMLVQGGMLSAVVGLAYWIHTGIMKGILYGLCTFILCALVTSICCVITIRIMRKQQA
ncbi:MAG: hypothetical protein IJM59_03775 [Proteobacteria bacterium]|nr:hypothetical protein [Pseudomonadota bacterium]